MRTRPYLLPTLLVALTLASCSPLLVPEADLPPDQGGAYCTFAVAAERGGSRSVMPGYDAESYWYRFSWTDSSGVTSSYPVSGGASYSDMTGRTFTLLTGSYTLSLDAYLDEACTQKVLSCTKDMALTAQTSSVQFAMKAPPAGDTAAVTTGAIRVTISFPQAAGVQAVTAKLTRLSDTSTAVATQDFTADDFPASGGTCSVTYSKDDVTAGSYVLFFILTDGSGNVTQYPELVTVAGGITSSNADAPIELDAASANVRYAVSYKNADGSDFDAWNGGVTAPLSFVAGQTVTLPDAASVDGQGRLFAGWYESASFSGSAVSQFTGTASDKTYYARWASLKTGSQINTILISLGAGGTATSFAQSTAKPADGAEVQYLGTVQSVPVWLDGTTIYYYAAGYTDSTSEKKILLNESCESMFSECSSLESIDVTGFDTRNVTTMRRMFYNCSALTSIDVSEFDTPNVTNMMQTFCGCSSLTELDADNWDTASVIYMNSLFSGCSELTSLGISAWDTAAVTSMSSMFSRCSSLALLDIRGWDTGSVTSLYSLFSGCSALTSLDLSRWDTTAVTDMWSMFSGCSSLASIDIQGWDTGSVAKMTAMFYNCAALTTLDLSGFDTAGVTEMQRMFAGCTSLSRIYVSGGFTTDSVTESTYMFSRCQALVGGAGTTYDSETIDKTYARIDGGTAAPGYFTAAPSGAVIYVSGTGGTMAAGSSSGDGSMAAPYATLAQAVQAINAQDSGDTAYTVYIDGTVSGTTTISALTAHSLAICGVTGSGTDALDATGTSKPPVSVTAENATISFSDVTLTGGSYDMGGGLYVGKTGTTVTLGAGTVITGNTNTSATYGGGGVAVNNGSTVICDGATITANTAAKSGGGVYVLNGEFRLVSGTISANTIQDADAGFGGGVSVGPNGTFSMSGGTISGHTVHQGGGVSYNGTFTMTGGTISGNTATGAGGGVVNSSTTAIFTMDGGTIQDNTALTGGGVYNAAGGTFTMSHGTVSGNTVTVSGGGIANFGSLTMTGGTVSGNSVTPAADDMAQGGGLYNGADGTALLSGGTIRENSAIGENYSGGGGIVNAGTLTLSDGILVTANTASCGGGIVNMGMGSVATLTMTGGTVSDNIQLGTLSLNVGGGILNYGGTFTMSGGTVSGNSSQSTGGGVFNQGVVVLSGGTITGNSAVSGGGVAHMPTFNGITSTLELSGVTISGNTAGGDGSGVYASGEVTISGSTVVTATGSEANDLFLEHTVLTVGGTLSCTAPVVSITPREYKDGEQVLGGTAALMESERPKLSVTDDAYGNSWGIGPDGRLLGSVAAVSSGLPADLGTAIQDASDGDAIYITTSVYISEWVSLAPAQGKTVILRRSPGFTGPLIINDSTENFQLGNTSGNTGTLILDGGSDVGLTASSPLLYVTKATTVDGVIFRNNSNTDYASGGGAIGIGSDAGSAQVVLKNVTISGCSAQNGGGVSIANSVQFEGCTIEGCSAVNCGGGIYIDGILPGQISIQFINQTTTIQNCTAGTGGGMYGFSNTQYNVQTGGNLSYSGNHASSEGDHLYLGGTLLYDGTLSSEKIVNEE